MFGQRTHLILLMVLWLTLGSLGACQGKPTTPPTATVMPDSTQRAKGEPSYPKLTTRAQAAPLLPRVRPYRVSNQAIPFPEQNASRGDLSLPYHSQAYGIPPLPHVITYTVKAGDTMSAIALRYGISLDSLRWSNPDVAYNPDDLYIGQQLRIPPLNGVVVTVKEGDTIERLARRYNVDPDVIRTYAPNHLKPPYKLKPGQLLVIPGGSRDINVPPPRPYPGYDYMWPVRGIITQPYHKYHWGLDIATVYNAGVYASRAGRVRVARWDDTGYGNMIIIDHGGGWNTLYAHMKGFLVQPGQWVNQGDIIGRVGGTGRATGPHIHFEIRKGRKRYDPQTFLPPSP